MLKLDHIDIGYIGIVLASLIATFCMHFLNIWQITTINYSKQITDKFLFSKNDAKNQFLHHLFSSVSV